MSTKMVLSIIAAIVVVGGGGWYLATQTGGSAAVENQAEQKEENAGQGSIAELIARAGSWTCTVKTDIENAPSQGVAYIADGKVRADFTSTVEGKAITSHMISADGYVHTWSDAYPQGIKMRIPEGQATTDSTVGGVSADTRVDYDCQPWAADGGKFVPPAEVSFMVMGEGGMPAMPEGLELPR